MQKTRLDPNDETDSPLCSGVNMRDLEHVYEIYWADDRDARNSSIGNPGTYWATWEAVLRQFADVPGVSIEEKEDTFEQRDVRDGDGHLIATVQDLIDSAWWQYEWWRMGRAAPPLVLDEHDLTKQLPCLVCGRYHAAVLSVGGYCSEECADEHDLLKDLDGQPTARAFHRWHLDRQIGTGPMQTSDKVPEHVYEIVWDDDRECLLDRCNSPDELFMRGQLPDPRVILDPETWRRNPQWASWEAVLRQFADVPDASFEEGVNEGGQPIHLVRDGNGRLIATVKDLVNTPWYLDNLERRFVLD